MHNKIVYSLFSALFLLSTTFSLNPYIIFPYFIDSEGMLGEKGNAYIIVCHQPDSDEFHLINEEFQNTKALREKYHNCSKLVYQENNQPGVQALRQFKLYCVELTKEQIASLKQYNAENSKHANSYEYGVLPLPNGKNAYTTFKGSKNIVAVTGECINVLETLIQEKLIDNVLPIDTLTKSKKSLITSIVEKMKSTLCKDISPVTYGAQREEYKDTIVIKETSARVKIYNPAHYTIKNLKPLGAVLAFSAMISPFIGYDIAHYLTKGKKMPYGTLTLAALFGSLCIAGYYNKLPTLPSEISKSNVTTQQTEDNTYIITTLSEHYYV